MNPNDIGGEGGDAGRGEDGEEDSGGSGSGGGGGGWVIWHHFKVSSCDIMFHMSVLPCRGIFGSLASSSRMNTALAVLKSRASLEFNKISFAWVAPLLIFLGTEVSSAS